MYRIKLSSQAKKELGDFKKRHQTATSLAIEDLKDDPFMGTKLGRELTGYYSYRVGVYRIIYRVDDKQKIVFIITFGHRSVVYD